MQLKSFFIGAIVGPVILLILALVLTLGGFVPVAATHEDSALTRWLLHSTYQQAVAREASTLSVPDTLEQRELILRGARNFTSMCRGCHTPPGEPDTAVSQGLNPPAPALDALLQHRSPAEAFVVIRDGVRMSGMAAFGPSHEDDELWALVAFLDTMKGADAATYQTLVQAAKQQSGNGDGHDHAHAGDPEQNADTPAGHEGHDHAH